MTTTVLAQEDTRPARYPRRWAAAIVMMTAAPMDLIDGTIANVALPTIRRDLQASGPSLEWVVSAYLLAFAATLITAGRVGDLVGRKRMFLAGVATFGLASLACGLSRNPGELIAARAAAGTAAAIMLPQVLATLRAVFTGQERGAAFGIDGAMGGIATAAGLLLGGVLTSANILGWGWRTIFFVNVPVALAALIAAAVLVPETRSERPLRPDLGGMALAAAGLVAIVYPLFEGRSLGWPAWCFGCLAGGRSGRRLAVRSRPPEVASRDRATAAGRAAAQAGFLGRGGGPAGLRRWAAGLFPGPGPVAAVRPALFAGPGVTTVAFSAGAFLTAGLSIQLAAKLGRTILVTGGLMMAAGMYGVLLAAQHSAGGVDPWQLVPGLVVAGAGLGFLVVPLINVVLAAVPAELAGGASGVFNTAQQLGGAVGVAVLGSVFFARVGSAGFTAGFELAILLTIGAFAVCAALSLALPRTAVGEAYE